MNNILVGIMNYLILRRYYKMKKKGFVPDLIYKKWIGLYKSDIKVSSWIYRFSGIEIKYLLYDIDKLTGHTGEGVKLDITGYSGVKPIRSCSFKEFKELYGDTIIDVLNNQRETVIFFI